MACCSSCSDWYSRLLAGAVGSNKWTHEPLAYAVGIAVAVLMYDGGLKRTPIGPVAMASCRFLNVLLGLSILPDEALDLGLRIDLAGVVGVYIIGVTWFARTEEGASQRRQLLAAAFVMLLALVLALIFKAKLPPGSGTFLYPYLLVAFGFVIGRPIARAIASPGPREVQRAVKRCVLGLVVLDAVLATAFAGLPALAILLLLPPAIVDRKMGLLDLKRFRPSRRSHVTRSPHVLARLEAPPWPDCSIPRSPRKTSPPIRPRPPRSSSLHHEAKLRPLELAANKAWWDANITGKDDDFKKKEETQNKIDAALSDAKPFATLKGDQGRARRRRTGRCPSPRDRSTCSICLPRKAGRRPIC